MKGLKKFLARLGPGLITGAADDDPSGIATYSITGARFGYGFLWTAIFTFPLMAAVQETCGRIGLVTKKGLAQIAKDHYPKPIVIVLSGLLFVANTFNIGANLSGMAAAINLLVPLPILPVTLVLSCLIIYLIIKLQYGKIVVVFKWLTLALFAYVVTFFLINHDYGAIITSTLLPTLTPNRDFVLTVLAIFGTTISPYLFFWQTSDEAQTEIFQHRHVTRMGIRAEQKDTVIGMFISNLIMYFIIATTAATLFAAGQHTITSAADAAAALRPLAGDLAFVLFAVGIVGTGMLAIPVLAGSASYALSETFGFHEGLNKKFKQAPGFYIIIISSTLLGFLLNLIGISPITYLFYSAVLNGLVSPVMIALLLLIANNSKIMGTYKNGLWTNLLTVVALVIMATGAIAIFLVN